MIENWLLVLIIQCYIYKTFGSSMMTSLLLLYGIINKFDNCTIYSLIVSLTISFFGIVGLIWMIMVFSSVIFLQYYDEIVKIYQFAKKNSNCDVDILTQFEFFEDKYQIFTEKYNLLKCKIDMLFISSYFEDIIYIFKLCVTYSLNFLMLLIDKIKQIPLLEKYIKQLTVYYDLCMYILPNAFCKDQTHEDVKVADDIKVDQAVEMLNLIDDTFTSIMELEKNNDEQKSFKEIYNPQNKSDIDEMFKELTQITKRTNTNTKILLKKKKSS